MKDSFSHLTATYRHSFRLQSYDYSQAGLYFVTICVHNRDCLFGKVIDHQMILNDAGGMVEKWFYKTDVNYPNIRCLDFVIMPNHIHCVWEITDIVGADPCVRPNKKTCVRPNKKTCFCLNQTGGNANKTGGHMGPPLHRVVQWFKTMTTNEYIRGVNNNGWKPFDVKLWQRNYYEHIIRDEQSYNAICKYIMNNPANWISENDI